MAPRGARRNNNNNPAGGFLRPPSGHVRVVRGESLASIAADSGLSIRQLQRNNGITSDMVWRCSLTLSNPH
jgi:LysM repeat protein